MEFNTNHIMIGIFAVSFLALMLLYFGLMQGISYAEKRKAIKRKIKASQPGPSPGRAATQTASGHHPLPTQLFKWAGALGRRLAGEESDLDNGKMRLFLRAGIRGENAPAIFRGTRVILIALFVLTFVMSRLTLFQLTNGPLTILIAVTLALTGYYLPQIWLLMMIRRRKDQLIKALPDALDLLVVCVEAGMGMDGAVHRVAEEIQLNSPALSDELKLLNRQLRAGKSRQDALRDLAVRTDLDALNSLSTLLIQTDKFGTSVATALRVFSDSYRTKRYQKAEEMAAKIPIKLVFPLILFIFPSLFVVILGSAAIRIYQNIIM